MPIKQVSCSICNQLVNKAITYSVDKDKRACRTHEGVMAKATEQMDARKKAEAPKPKPRREPEPFSTNQWSPPSLQPKCWVCMNPGLQARDFFTRVLVEREKAATIYGPWNPFDPKHPGNNLNLGRCIFVLPKDKCVDAMKYVREEFAMLVDMSGGFLAICGQCCHACNIDPLPKNDPKPEDLSTYMVIGELVRPVIQKIAGAELARDN